MALSLASWFNQNVITKQQRLIPGSHDKFPSWSKGSYWTFLS